MEGQPITATRPGLIDTSEDLNLVSLDIYTISKTSFEYTLKIGGMGFSSKQQAGPRISASMYP